VPAQQQQHGIRRGTTRHPLPPIQGREDTAALAKDVRDLLAAVKQVQDVLNDVENRLVLRVNEMMLSGLLGNRPAAGVTDRIFMTTDVGARALYYDIGGEWVPTGSSGRAEEHEATMLADAVAHTFTMNQPDALYTPAFATTWWTMVKITGRTPTALTVEFSNPASAGDVIVVHVP
jgi:hypothetical protein